MEYVVCGFLDELRPFMAPMKLKRDQDCPWPLYVGELPDEFRASETA